MLAAYLSIYASDSCFVLYAFPPQSPISSTSHPFIIDQTVNPFIKLPESLNLNQGFSKPFTSLSKSAMLINLIPQSLLEKMRDKELYHSRHSPDRAQRFSNPFCGMHTVHHGQAWESWCCAEPSARRLRR